MDIELDSGEKSTSNLSYKQPESTKSSGQREQQAQACENMLRTRSASQTIPAQGKSFPRLRSDGPSSRRKAPHLELWWLFGTDWSLVQGDDPRFSSSGSPSAPHRPKRAHFELLFLPFRQRPVSNLRSSQGRKYLSRSINIAELHRPRQGVVRARARWHHYVDSGQLRSRPMERPGT